MLAIFGFDTGNIAGTLTFLKTYFGTTDLGLSIIVSITILFAFAAALLSGRLVDKFGRKSILIISAILFSLGALVTAATIDITMLIFGRALLGIAIGLSSYTAPLYISEISPPEKRGRLVLVNGIAITAGEAIAFIIDYGLSYGGHWRLMFLTGLIPALALWAGMMVLPRSPRWLIAQGKTQEAHHAFLRLNIPIEKIPALIANIQSICQQKTLRWHKIFTHSKMRKPLIIAIALGIFQQFFGINTIMYYGPIIFTQTGHIDTSSAIFVTFIMGLINTAMTVITALTVDRLGRKTLLILGSLVAGISLMMASWVHHYLGHSPHEFFWLVPTLGLYIVGYCISVGSLFWLVIAEIFPLQWRGLGMSLATGIQWLANFIVSVSFLPILDKIGFSQCFLIYAVICIGCAIFTLLYIPETKQKSLEHIEEKLW